MHRHIILTSILLSALMPPASSQPAAGRNAAALASQALAGPPTQFRPSLLREPKMRAEEAGIGLAGGAGSATPLPMDACLRLLWGKLFERFTTPATLNAFAQAQGLELGLEAVRDALQVLSKVLLVEADPSASEKRYEAVLLPSGVRQDVLETLAAQRSAGSTALSGALDRVWEKALSDLFDGVTVHIHRDGRREESRVRWSPEHRRLDVDLRTVAYSLFEIAAFLPDDFLLQARFAPKALVSMYSRYNRSGFRHDLRTGVGTTISTNRLYPDLARQLTDKLLALAPPGLVVSVGAAGGWIETSLVRAGIRVVGIDLHVSDAFRWEKPIVEVVPADAHHLPFRGGKASSILFLESLGHGDIPRQLREAWDALAPGGTLVIAQPIGDARAAQEALLNAAYKMLPPEVLKRAIENEGFVIDEETTLRDKRDVKARLLYLRARKPGPVPPRALASA